MHHYYRVTQTSALGEAPLEPSLELSPSRAVTKAKASALADVIYIKELLLDAHIQRRKVL
jgi:hypothetical protein